MADKTGKNGGEMEGAERQNAEETAKKTPAESEPSEGSFLEALPKAFHKSLPDGSRLDSSEAAVTMQPGACWTLNISESPSAAVAWSLSQVWETDVARTYFWSAKAAAGRMRSAEKKKKKIPDALRVPLLSLAQRLTLSAGAD